MMYYDDILKDELFEKRLCLKCSTIGAHYMCQRCMDFYCSRTCQLDDWHHHKRNCFPIPKLININDLIRPNIVGGADVNKLLPKSVTNNLMMEMLNDADAPPKEVTDAPTPPATTIKFNGKMKESLKVLRLPHTDSLRAPKECTKSSPPPKARIEVMPIQLKKQLAMYCWDMSSICSGGRIMVSVFDQDRIRFIQEQLPAKIAAHCASLRPPMQEYRPEVGEFCLAIYADDDQWYRAECIGVLADGGGASLRFIDYGNVTHVKWARIRPMSEEFRAVPIMVHDCSIAGVPLVIPAKVAANYLKMYPVFVGRAELDKNCQYLIHLNIDNV